eukprot:CAMPEP_0183715262 /NCGR_PEP_ID=MMETSP0737-20130205/9567_1 /TAXON_ID=385413 /ORGANISM="Thalassiosira miniscula, Strain CCMP1093" /LENGTH=174 /DNA_ID=CAMNT_0025944351 /DNA_START=35 /DNA_END=559 /DNA_ORIENTATION=+
MANAAAKKAAAARETAASTYFPIVIGLNAVYLLLRLFYQRISISSPSSIAATLGLVGLSFVSYKGILEDHANTIGKHKGDALAGGASLDLLGLVVVVQYGTIFFTPKLYWALVLIPLWGGWKLYSTFFGSKGGSGDGSMPKNPLESDAAVDKAAAEKADAKRQKRAERRRQKWA